MTGTPASATYPIASDVGNVAKMFEGTTAVTFAGLVSSALIASVALERR